MASNKNDRQKVKYCKSSSRQSVKRWTQSFDYAREVRTTIPSGLYIIFPLAPSAPLAVRETEGSPGGAGT